MFRTWPFAESKPEYLVSDGDQDHMKVRQVRCAAQLEASCIQPPKPVLLTPMETEEFWQDDTVECIGKNKWTC